MIQVSITLRNFSDCYCCCYELFDTRTKHVRRSQALVITALGYEGLSHHEYVNILLLVSVCEFSLMKKLYMQVKVLIYIHI